MLSRTIRLTPFILLAVLAVGCARPGDPPVIDRLKPFFRLSVTLGTNRVLMQNHEMAPVVLQVTTTLMTLFDTAEVVSLAQIDAAVRAKLATMQLEDDVRLVLEALMESVAMEIRLVIMQTGVAADQVTILAMEVVGWMRDAALRHVQMPLKKIGR